MKRLRLPRLAPLASSIPAWVLAIGLLVVTETHGVPAGDAEPRFVALMFEAVSAFGTVGLSTGITPSLSAAGKLVLVALIAVWLARRGRGRSVEE